MKRYLLGIALLGLLLAGALGVWQSMETHHGPVAEELVRAAEFSRLGDPVAAADAARRAKNIWEDHWRFSAAFADHGPMEQIDDLFRALEAYDPASVDFRARCLQLAERATAMIDDHAFNWWNLL